MLKQESRKKLGSLLFTGFEGLELSASTERFLQQSGLSGVILFSKNFDQPVQLAELTNQIYDLNLEAPLWVSVDQEGGSVQRFKKGFTKLPAASHLGASLSPRLAFEIASIQAKELKAVGIDINFAPVADIAAPGPEGKPSIMISRSFGSQEKEVSQMVSAVVRGHLTQGVQPCLKHFPGHGATHEDSHHLLPQLHLNEDQLISHEIKPFLAGLKSKCAMVMVAHLLLPNLDSHWPFSLSKQSIQNWLRKKIGFDELIFSDDLEMGAVTECFEPAQIPVMAFNAGCDLLLYRSEEKAMAALESLIHAFEQGQIESSQLEQAYQRNQKMKHAVLKKKKRASVTDLNTILAARDSLEVVAKLYHLQELKTKGFKNPNQEKHRLRI